METQVFKVTDNKLHTQDNKVFLSKKGYAQKYGLSLQALVYLKHKKRVLTIDILGAKFFEDKPPIKMRYQNLDK